MIHKIMDTGTMDTGTVSDGTMDNGTKGQWGNETMVAGLSDDLILEQGDNGTIDIGTIEQWTIGTRGPRDNQTVGH
jgi:hypothetical protein